MVLTNGLLLAFHMDEKSPCRTTDLPVQVLPTGDALIENDFYDRVGDRYRKWNYIGKPSGSL